MTDFDSAALERAVTDDSIDFSERDARALTQYLTVLEDYDRARGADDLYMVVSQSGEEYLVDTRTETCECPDHEYRDVRCKHLRRVAFATRAEEIPAWVDRDAVDDQLGIHLSEGAPRQAATDGGVVEAVGDDTDDEDVVDRSEEYGEAASIDVHHIIGVDGDRVPVDPADCDRCGSLDPVPCLNHFMLGAEFPA